MSLSKKNKFFLVILVIYFVAVASVHFARLMFSWEVMIGETEISTIISGVCILFSVSIIFLILHFFKKNKKEEGLEEKTKEYKEE